MYEYVKRVRPPSGAATKRRLTGETTRSLTTGSVDRTAKLYIGGTQARPDGGSSIRIIGASGKAVGEVGEGNRKDIRNAVEAARNASGSWSRTSGHARAQILYYIAENLSARGAEFTTRIRALVGGSAADANAELDATVRRLFTYAAWADKWDGAVHNTPLRGITIAMHEPVGVIGMAAPDTHPLLGFVSVVAPAIATGNTVVALPSQRHPLAVTDFYQVLDTSDLPAGVINIVTGKTHDLATVLAEHDDVDAIWYFGDADGVKACELASGGNMKQTWCESASRAWTDLTDGEGREFLRHATQIKNIWIPYGE
jgi:aldehyde dehydrogenase (NAD+)